MPILWVVSLEAVRYLVTGNRRAANRQASETIPMARWVLSPGRTALLYRRMRLWGIGSYRLAVSLEAARLYGMHIALTLIADKDFSWYRRTKRSRLRAKLPGTLYRDLMGGDFPDHIRSMIENLVELGRSTGWRDAVHAWVADELRTPSEALSAALEGGVAGGPGGASEATVPSVFGGAFEGAPGGALGGGSGGASRGPLGGGPGGGSGNGRKNGKGGAKNSAKNDEDPRLSIEGWSEAAIAAKVKEIADRHESENGGERLSPTALSNKYLRIGYNRARPLVDAHYARATRN
jgi:hypothetical protein